MGNYISRVKTWIAGEILYASDLNSEFDNAIDSQIPEPSGATQGDVLVMGASSWERLAAGTSGYFLKTQGAGSNPAWAAASDSTLTTRGDLLYRGASANARLAIGTANQYLTTNGTDPSWAALDISHDTSPTLGGELAVGEYGILFDSALSADGKYSGLICTGTYGDTLVYKDLIYLNDDDNRWEKADADAEATAGPVILGIALESGSDGSTGKKIFLYGFIREDDWNWNTGDTLFVSCTTGEMTQTAPSGSGDIVRAVGRAWSDADSIFFNPSPDWFELA